jgi:glycosyltransferase involved in cell wall biosynthesis
MDLYVRGRRRIRPPIRFGLGVLGHLARHARRYDVVHTASFPYFSLLAAGALRRRGGYQLVVDWHEVWSDEYWREYLGVAGLAGIAVQRRCARIRQRAFCFSRLHAQRLRDEGLRGEVEILEGEYAGSLVPEQPREAEPLVVFAGRMIPEKRAPVVVDAVVEAAKAIPDLHGLILGDGPQRPEVLARIESLGAAATLSAPGFVDSDTVHDALGRALCMVLPSRREGYGMVVVEAAACGTPSVLVREPDNAATELIEDDVNGVIAASAAPSDLAAAIARVHAAGPALRERTRDWFAQTAPRLSIDRSIERVLASYGSSSARPSASE